MVERENPLKPLRVRDIHKLAGKLRYPVVAINWVICDDTVGLLDCPFLLDTFPCRNSTHPILS
jgi:hypothetical protein